MAYVRVKGSSPFDAACSLLPPSTTIDTASAGAVAAAERDSTYVRERMCLLILILYVFYRERKYV